MIIDWLNSWDKTKSPDWAQAELTNWYLVANQRGKLPLAAMPSPGALLFSSNAGSVWRGLHRYNSILYGVLDNIFYKILSDGTLVALGVLSTSTGRVRFAHITNQIVMIDGTKGYHFAVNTVTFQIIPDPDFLGNANSITSQDEYFIVNNPGTPFITYSDISNGLSWNALNLLQKNGMAQNVTAVKSIYPYIWIFGESSMEPYFNSGTPFERDNTGTLKVGILAEAADTVALCTDSMFFLAANESGGYQVMRAKPGSAVSVSHNISYQLKQVTDLTDAFGYVYLQEDMEFYCLTIPSISTTFNYNITTQSWNKQESLISASYTRHIANCYTFCYGKQIIGDFQSGNLYYMDTDTYTENGTRIRRTLVTYPFYKESLNITGNRLIVEFETAVGTDAQVDISFSKDNGHNYTLFTPSRSVSNTPGKRALIYDRLGSSRQWNFKVQTTMTGKCVMLGAIGDFRVGVN